MARFSDNGFVIDSCAGVDDGIILYAGFRIDDGPGHDGDA